MLQRLPGLGRVKAESNDRQFIDVYILDGLRANDVRDCVILADQGVHNEPWSNPLDVLGQRILANELVDDTSIRKFLQLANRCASGKNRVMACDIAATMLRMGRQSFDFAGLAIDDGYFLVLDMSKTIPINLRISNSVFGTICLPPSDPPGTKISGSIAERVYGVSSVNGLPDWASGLSADQYDSVENIARIRKIGLSAPHEILTALVRKTFFQKGSGRKEAALLRGLGKIASASVADRIVNILLREDILHRFKGDEGWVYTPNRSHAGRMNTMLSELTMSRDPIWTEVSGLSH